jgi:hypothetical protein
MQNDTRVLAAETVVERTAVQNINKYVRARGKINIMPKTYIQGWRAREPDCEAKVTLLSGQISYSLTTNLLS